jgi:hypothetical protein
MVIVLNMAIGTETYCTVTEVHIGNPFKLPRPSLTILASQGTFHPDFGVPTIWDVLTRQNSKRTEEMLSQISIKKTNFSVPYLLHGRVFLPTFEHT